MTASRKWTEDEDYIVLTLYPSQGWHAVHELTKRSKAGILMRAQHLNVKLDPAKRLEIMTECAAHARDVKENPPPAVLPTDATRILNTR